MKFTISTFSGKRDNIPGRGDLTWEQIVDSLARVRPSPCTLATCERSDCEHKSGLSWCPAAWPPGHKRKVYGIESVSLLIADLDHVPPAELPAMLARVAPFRHVLHASHSDQPNDRCLRVVLQPSRPVPGPDWPRFWRATMRWLGLPADEKTKDASRLFYAPSRPHDACHLAPDGTGYTFGVRDGAVIDVDAILAAAPPVDFVEYDDFEVPDYEEVPEEKFLAAVKRLAAAWPAPGKNRHEAHLALAGALARAGWPAEVIAEFAYGVAHTQIPGSGDRRKRLTAARSSVEKVHTGALVKGWPGLEAIISAAGNDGPAAIAEVTELLGIGRAPVLDEAEIAAYDVMCDLVLTETRKRASEQEKQHRRTGAITRKPVEHELLARLLIPDAFSDAFPELAPYLTRVR